MKRLLTTLKAKQHSKAFDEAAVRQALVVTLKRRADALEHGESSSAPQAIW